MTPTLFRIDFKTIIICEPMCWGFEHSSFNAAFLQSFQSAFPEAAIYFLGEKQHINDLKSILTEAKRDCSKIIWKEFKIFRRNDPRLKRFSNDFSWCIRLLRNCEVLRADYLAISSINSTGLMALKILMKLRNFRVPTIAVLHSDLADLLGKASWRKWDIRKAISFLHPEGLRLVALGDSIYSEILKLMPVNNTKWIVLNHPYLWPPDPQYAYTHSIDRHICFGFFGAANGKKGFDWFCALADEIVPRYPDVEFLLVGFYYGFSTDTKIGFNVKGVSSEPLSVEKFHERASHITYSIWLGEPEHYRVTASATFLDSLAYLKPSIYIRNKYIDHYVQSLGDIGYACTDFRELVDTVETIASDFPRERYKSQISNILKGRSIFDPEQIGKRLHTIMNMESDSYYKRNLWL